MIIQTWSVLSTVPGKNTAAWTNFIQLAHQFDHILYCPCTGIRAKIFSFILTHSPGKQYSGIFFIYRYFDKRVTFVILKHGIILWPMLLDQITLQHKGFQFRICNDIFESGYMCYHLFYFGPFIPATLKILPNPVFQAYCLSHINDLILLAMHNINPRFPRKLF